MPNGARARPSKANLRPDHNGPQRAQFESNKKKIYATQKVCGICGKPVDFRLKFPHPLSPCIDHIIPVAKGGHIAYQVDELDAKCENKKCFWPQMDVVPGIRIAFFVDENGVVTEYCQMS